MRNQGSGFGIRDSGFGRQDSGKIRLDELLVQRGMVESRARAQAHIIAGNVLVDDGPVSKNGMQVPVDAVVRFKKEPTEYVGRGALKLEGAFAAFPIAVSDQVVFDIGQSTGGFTEVLLRRGVKTVIGIDVGYGQVHSFLRGDARAWCVERCNARELTREMLATWAQKQKPVRDASVLNEIVGFVMDVSFISVTKILPAIKPLLTPESWGLILIKPQFEAGPSDVEKGGLVTKPDVLQRVLNTVCDQIAGQGWQLKGMAKAAIKGADGNQEFVLWVTL